MSFSESTCSGVSKNSNLIKVRELLGQLVPQHDVAPEPRHLESHLVSQIKAKDSQFCSRHMKSFGDVVNNFKKSKNSGVQAYVVNLIQLCTALALASDHLQRWQPHLWKATLTF
jgi:hypothetical protein